MAEWEDVTVRLTSKTEERKILQDVSGSVRFGRLLAILGPSGSGKTTLINLVAGQAPACKRIAASGRIHRSGPVSLVEQDDLFIASETVEETLTFHAALRMSTPPESPKVRTEVQSILRQMNLVHVKDTRIGDVDHRGISGGERKRLSIACALVCAPSILCLDEPTTGLDSWMAASVVQQLRTIADTGAAVAFSVHQPRAQSLALVDDVLLLTAEGRVAFEGPRDALGAHLSKVGHPVPSEAAVAEWAIDVVSIDYSSVEGESSSRARVAAVADAHAAAAARGSVPSLGGGGATRPAQARPPPPCTTSMSKLRRWMLGVRLLVARTLRCVKRDKKSTRVRMTSSLSSALLFAAIYYRLTGRIDVTGLLQVTAVNTGMVAMQKTIRGFASERQLVRREMSSSLYTSCGYVLSKLLAEVPWAALFPFAFSVVLYPLTGLRQTLPAFSRFAGTVVLEAVAASSLGLAVGAWAPTADAASAMGPFVMAMFIVFGGMYVRMLSVPALLRWVPAVSTVKLAFHALMQNEFGPDHAAVRELDLASPSFGAVTVRQMQMVCAFYLLSYAGFALHRTRYVTLDDNDASKSPSRRQSVSETRKAQ